MRLPHVRPLASLVSAFTLCCSATAFAQSSGVIGTVMGTFNEPWAIEFLPDGRALVTEKGGSLKLLAGQSQIHDITGEPLVAYGGQGGLGDIVLHPGATIEDSELELERGRYVYQVELRGSTPAEEWDIEIDAATGEVLSDHAD